MKRRAVPSPPRPSTSRSPLNCSPCVGIGSTCPTATKSTASSIWCAAATPLAPPPTTCSPSVAGTGASRRGSITPEMPTFMKTAVASRTRSPRACVPRCAVWPTVCSGGGPTADARTPVAVSIVGWLAVPGWPYDSCSLLPPEIAATDPVGFHATTLPIHRSHSPVPPPWRLPPPAHLSAHPANAASPLPLPRIPPRSWRSHGRRARVGPSRSRPSARRRRTRPVSGGSKAWQPFP